MSDLNDLFKVIAEGKKDFETNDPKGKILKEVKDNAHNDLSGLFSQLENIIINDIELQIGSDAIKDVVKSLTEEVPLKKLFNQKQYLHQKNAHKVFNMMLLNI